MKTFVPPADGESMALAQRHGYDPWLVARFLEYVPEPGEFLAKMDAKPRQYIRVNTLKTPAQDVVRRLEAKAFRLSQTSLPEVFSVDFAPLALGATTEYLLGCYYVQDLSSALAVEALDVSAGQSVLDIGAAPGGKTTMIAQRMGNTGAVVALEPNRARARSLTFNLARCGVFNTCIVQRPAEDSSKLGAIFDRVLLDAPCSCEGVIAKDPSRKTSHTPSDVEFCSDRQALMIEAAAKAVRPGGVLVYSTCSFAPEENEAIVDYLLKKRPDATVEPAGFGSPGLTRFGQSEYDPRVEACCRLYPHLHDTTGFFIAKLRFG